MTKLIHKMEKKVDSQKKTKAKKSKTDSEVKEVEKKVPRAEKVIKTKKAKKVKPTSTEKKNIKPKATSENQATNEKVPKALSNLDSEEVIKKAKKTIRKKNSDINLQESIENIQNTILLEQEKNTLSQEKSATPNRNLKFIILSSLIMLSVIFFFYHFEKGKPKNTNTQIAAKAILAQINKKEEWEDIETEELKIQESEPELLTFEENLSYLEAKKFCERLNQRIPKIKELKRFFEGKDSKEYSLNRIWSNNKNRKNNQYIYDIGKKIDLVEDRKNMKYGVICFD